SKHSVEKTAALEADCLTTVSEVTDRECLQFFGRSSDVILPNGFEPSFFSKGAGLQTIRHRARKTLLNTYNALAGTALTDNTLIVSTSGRNDFRCKGFDVYLGALAKLERDYKLERDILAVIAVPCWKKQPREDLCTRLKGKPAIKIFDASGLEPLPHPFITHDLYNFDSERIVNTIYNCGLSLSNSSKVHLLFIPSYLDGDDGVINMTYYDFLTGSDYCVYPSYYEPWGYTPLESIAFGIPCLTTNLSGFGQWVNTTVGHTAILSDGVAVIQRDDSNYERVTDEIATSIQGVLMLMPDEYSKIRATAKALSDKALWKDFIRNYINAYTLAMKHAANRG
ncbi:MAG: glycosyltransferase, partial [Bacteroidaceae bacterium]